MKNYTILSLLCAFTILFSACSENNELSQDQNVFFEITEIKTTSKTTPYQSNLEVQSGPSYFNVETNRVQLQIPIATGNFQYYNSYDISSDTQKALFVVISDNSNKTSLEKEITHLMDGFIGFDSINNFSSLNTEEELLVIIYNDNIDHFTSNQEEILADFRNQVLTGTVSMFERRPRESGGGVIVEGP